MEQVVIQRVQEALPRRTTKRTVRIQEKNLIIVCHMDDRVIFRRATADTITFCDDMGWISKIEDLGKHAQFVGMEWMWIPYREVGFRRSTLIDNLLRATGMENYKLKASPIIHDVGGKEISKEVALSTEEPTHYRSIIGSLLYNAKTSRPDVASAANILGRYISYLTTVNMAKVRRALRYLRLTKVKISSMNPKASIQL